MNFTAQRKILLNLLSNNQQNKLKDYEKISTLRDQYKKLDEFKDYPVDALYSDIIMKELGVKLKCIIFKNYYYKASIHATNCLEIEIECRKIPLRQVDNWTQNALKCFDNILIFIVTEIKKDKIQNKEDNKCYEQDVYQYYIDKDWELKNVGKYFRIIYNIRSTFVHVQYKDEKGFRQIRKISQFEIKRKKTAIIDYFEKALSDLLIYIKKIIFM